MSKEQNVLLHKIDHLPLAAMSSSYIHRESKCQRECYVGFGALVFGGGVCLLVMGTVMLVSPDFGGEDRLWVMFLTIGSCVTFIGISMTCYCSKKKTRYRTVNSDIINQTINQTILLHEGASRGQRKFQTMASSSPNSTQALLPRLSQGSTSTNLVKKNPAFMNDPQHPVQFGIPWTNHLFDSTSQSSSGYSTHAAGSTSTVQQPSISSSGQGQSSSSSSSATSVVHYSTAPPKKLYKQSSC